MAEHHPPPKDAAFALLRNVEQRIYRTHDDLRHSDPQLMYTQFLASQSALPPWHRRDEYVLFDRRVKLEARHEVWNAIDWRKIRKDGVRSGRQEFRFEDSGGQYKYLKFPGGLSWWPHFAKKPIPAKYFKGDFPTETGCASL